MNEMNEQQEGGTVIPTKASATVKYLGGEIFTVGNSDPIVGPSKMFAELGKQLGIAKKHRAPKGDSDKPKPAIAKK